MRLPIRACASVVLAVVACTTQATGQCPRAHCQARVERVVDACLENAQAGSLVFLDAPAEPGQSCYCECGGIAIDTPVAIAPGELVPLDRLEAGASVLTLQRDGQWRPVRVVLGRRHRQPGRSLHQAIHLEAGNGTRIVTTAGHVFLLADRRTLRRADQLQLEDKLLDARTLAPVAIERIDAGSYRGPMRSLGVARKIEGDAPWGHLLDTGGLVSGDYFVQLSAAGTYASGLPRVGSAAYPRTAAPQDAPPFLPSGEDQAVAGKLLPPDDPGALVMAEYLINKYQRAYPEVEFLLEWENDGVNAFARKHGEVRSVRILGGAFRHVDMGPEGAGLILAHELGHHFGGKPANEHPALGWSSCEGQADYWGATVAQRNVWWGSQAVENTRKGAEQLYRVMTTGLVKPPSTLRRRAGPCDNPKPACRRDTYLAGNRLDPKPACAGDPPDGRR